MISALASQLRNVKVENVKRTWAWEPGDNFFGSRDKTLLNLPSLSCKKVGRTT